MSIKLKQFTAATNNNITTFKFIVTGLNADASVKHCLVSDQSYTSKSLYDEQLLTRLYAITNQQATCTTPLEPLISITQFANNEFALTESTITPPTYDNTPDQHSIVQYYMQGTKEQSIINCNPTGPSASTFIDKMSIISDNSTVFGYVGEEVGGSTKYIFVKDANVTESNMLAYSLSTAAPNISKNYIMENRLTALADSQYTLWAWSSASTLNSDGSTPVADIQLYVKNASATELECYRKGNLANNDDISYNFTPAKNIYDNNWELQLADTKLDAIREYTKIGNSNGSLYLKYRVYSGDVEDSGLYEYEMIERIKGLYKFKSDEGHKSNVFSIRVENSGIAKLVDPDNSEYKEELKNLLHDSIKKFVQKLIPANTQLWKIQFTGV